MASDTTRFNKWLIEFVLVSVHVLLVCSSASPQSGGKVTQHAVKELSRGRRDACVDGTYLHEGRTCCLCGAGQKLVSHCSVKQDDGQCQPCDPGTYSSHPNAQEFCEKCTSCEQPNANLEVREPCTPGRDAKCQCKQNHYCTSGTESCRLCQPCKECGAEGVKVDCTQTSNTICNEKTEGLSGGTIAAIIVSVALIAFIAAAVMYYLRGRKKKLQMSRLPPAHPPDVEMQPLKDIQMYLPDIANVLEWKDMRDIAMHRGILNTAIEACKLDHPGDTQEQTLQLLGKWVEKEGSGASEILIQVLQNSGKRTKAETVTNILRSGCAA